MRLMDAPMKLDLLVRSKFNGMMIHLRQFILRFKKGLQK